MQNSIDPWKSLCLHHYADLAVMAEVPVKDDAPGDLDLLSDVCIHKDRFYHCGWARYMEARPGSFHLLPRTERLSDLRNDYQTMKVMFFDDAPEFDSILEHLANLESEFNNK
ncbi:MAG: nucleotidyl transferase AbiEii/AbiGii toxin family protein [Candidatus Aegiribacteria sp.]|nr:nucleotidyl transferase AbiEii/AbiGii toxin family protein [Candidatus Aegiribacteria sp.]